ncbi:hypothetical protein [Chryseobacterium sp. SORGH_AS_1048]|uniref:hypothetical protein n=1 Tax=Chryseobacterium sp. SORGH_AS_1048 TaxID=3041783 RepID=UPI0027862110|nr:hypothetical protein [Chryseobacterium sp. SORGH_AS_1048]MDQ1101688.1 hypothetical protein [Chryseobacterium sp. SORGH_AS_1048]
MSSVTEGGKVTACLQVPRNGDHVRFLEDRDSEHIKFFQRYITSKEREAVKSEPYSSVENKGITECQISAVSMWYPADEYGSNAGYWETNYIVTCPPEPTDGDGNEGGEQPTYPYPGGGGSTSPQNPKNPCEKMKAQNQNQGFKDKVAALDKPEMFNKSTETGYSAAYGTVPYESLANSSNGNVRFPEGNKYFGYMHTHLNMEGVVKIFSPYDVATFLTSCVANAKLKGNMTDAYAMVITSEGNYILKYSGDGNFAVTVGQLENWKTWYGKQYGELFENKQLTQPNVEKLFTKFLQEVVNINGLEVYQSDKATGSTSKLQYNGADNPVQSIPCPQ